MSKLLRDGHVAVLYSPGFGSCWYDPGFPSCLTDQTVVDWVLAGKPKSQLKEIETYLALAYGEDFLTDGLRQLAVSWIPEGIRFVVHDYDGSEYILREDLMPWIVA